jgi:L-histidine Nalpha-methyltransferase / hercynylcysteine S-oxide synthase
MSQYSLWLLERPPFSFSLLPAPSCNAGEHDLAPFGAPSRQDWTNIWAVWDFVTRRMIPSSMLFQKPIDLRHICLFYLGHIPTFLDIHLSNLLQEPNTEPTEFKASYVLPLEMGSSLTLDNRIFLRLVHLDDLKQKTYNTQRGIDPNVDDPTQCHVSKKFLYAMFNIKPSSSRTLKYQTIMMPGPARLPSSNFKPPCEQDS